MADCQHKNYTVTVPGRQFPGKIIRVCKDCGQKLDTPPK